MNYAHDEYLSLAALMTDMSEDLIAESDIRSVTTVNPRRERASRFSAFMNHPAMVAVLCAVVSLGVVAAIVLAGRGGPFRPPVVETPPPETETQDPEKDYEKQKSLYNDIIAEYTALLTAKQNGEELPALNTDGMDEREAAIATALHGIVDSCKDAETAQNLGYGFKDMDGNGTPELILLTKYTSIQAIFTISDKKPILLEANYGQGTTFMFATNNRFFMLRDQVTDSIEEATVYIWRVDGDKIAYDSVYGAVYDQEKKEILEYYQIVDGERKTIDKDTYNELDREYRQIINKPGFSTDAKLLTPYIHFPLTDKVPTENLPVADFSSYAAIRETYKAISACLEDFESAKWFQGEYDDLFAFPDDISFEYYTQLLYTACHGAYCEGYDEIDLNGDGQDELVIMNEDYTIKAIFTQRNGKPVLLDAFAYETCWLDDQGLIHVDRIDYYELEYSLYEFTKEGDYSLVYAILVAENGNRYLTKDGKTEKISFEESLEIYYDDYCRYTEPFSPHEQTRNVSSLTYTPLVEPTEDLRKAAADKTWHKNADLEKTSGKEWGAWGNTYVTFENVTDSGMDVNFKYVFTFNYPDPDRENYLLTDTTESSLKITASNQDGVFVFDESGIKGHFEFGQKYLWIIIDESTDQRFPAGAHCYFVQENSEEKP